MVERRYTKNGEWVSYDGVVWKVGLAASAATELGDVTFVETPVMGRTVVAGEAICTLEAVKAAADFYAPLGGRIVDANPLLAQQPELVSQSPEDAGWLLALEAVDPAEFAALMDPTAWNEWEAGR